MTSWNALDHPWVPVTGPDGPQVVTVREALTRSDRLTGLAAAGPTEQDALMRFLVPMAALVLREGDSIHDTEAVDRVLERHRPAFELLDQDRPFLQEWHVTPAERDGVTQLDLMGLHVHHPGASTAPWGLRPDGRDPASPQVLPLLLLTAWYDRVNGNTGAPSFYRGKKVSALGQATRSGEWLDRTYFYLLGEDLATTLGLNVVEDWLDGGDLPAWLDQDAVPTPAQVPEAGLWRYTWSPNRALVLHDDDGPTGWVSGLTRRPVPAMGGKDVKEDVKLVVGTDHHTVLAPVKNRKEEPVEGKFYRVRLVGDLSGTQGLEHWYRERMTEAVVRVGSSRAEEDHAATAVAAWVDQRDGQGNGMRSEWVEADLKLLTVPPSHARDAVLGMASAFTGGALKDSLNKAAPGQRKGTPSPALEQARVRIYSALDTCLLPALARLAAGQGVDLKELARSTLKVTSEQFATITAPYATPARMAQVSEARDQYEKATRLSVKHLVEGEA